MLPSLGLKKRGGMGRGGFPGLVTSMMQSIEKLWGEVGEGQRGIVGSGIETEGRGFNPFR